MHVLSSIAIRKTCKAAHFVILKLSYETDQTRLRKQWTARQVQKEEKAISEKAKISGLTVREYDEGLQRLRKLVTSRLALSLNLFEQDSLDNSFDRLKEAEKWIRENKDYRAMLFLEKERREMMKNLIDAGRILNPYSQKEDEAEPQVRREPLPDLERWGAA